MEKFLSPEPAENGSTTTARGPWADAAKSEYKQLEEYVRSHIRETGQPETLRGKLPHTPSDLAGFRVVGRYHEAPKKDRARDLIPCAFSGHGHYKGYVIWFPNGTLCLIGHVCGVKDFGAEAWHSEKDRFEQTQVEIELREGLVAVQPYLEQAILQIDSFAKSPATRAATKAMRTLRSEMPDLHGYLYRAATKNNGDLNIEREQSGKFRQGGGKAHRHDRYQATTIARLQGHQALVSRAELVRPAKDAAHGLGFVYKEMADKDISNLDRNTLKQAIRLISEAIAEMEKLFGRCQGIFRFWSYENRKAICDWANHPDNGQLWDRYRTTRTGIAIEGSRNKGPGLPYRFGSLPDLDALWDMREAFRAVKPPEEDSDGK